MKKIIFNIAFMILSIAAFITISSCNEREVFTYNSRNALWFERDYKDPDLGVAGQWVRVDTVEISSTFYPGQDEYIHNFKVNLIGPLLTEPKQYKVILVDTLSQQDALQYISIPETTLFASGVISDNLPVTIQVAAIPEGFRSYVTYSLVENENFRDGYSNNQTIKIWINNIPTKPLWWKKTVEQAFLGPYSKEKFEVFILVTGLITLEGLESQEMRNICRKVKKYVEENGVTEADGSPMIIPIY